MREQWGRSRDAGDFDNRKSVWRWVAVAVALLCMAGVWGYRYAVVWTPLQRWYVGTYISSEFKSEVGLKTGRYTVLNVVGRKGSHWAFNDEVVSVKTANGEKMFALTPEAVAIGDVRLEWQRARVDNEKFHAILNHWIYQDQTISDLFMPGVWSGLMVGLVGFAIAIPKDAVRARIRKEGRRLKGPELVTVRKFNRKNRSDGIGFEQNPQTRIQRLFKQQPILRLPRRVEANHILIMGDTGTGKSTLIRKILWQIEERGETAIVYDSALDYTPKFYNPERGDVILNPLDQRMPYWSPGEELTHDVEALTLAASLFPDRRNENPFFVEGPRKIFAHLLTFRPTPEEMAWWMCHEEEIDLRVKGTQYAAMIDKQAPAQRSGVLASLNMVADSLKLLPSEKETTRRWSAAEWSKERKGWLFLTSTTVTRERLLPLTSLWLDTLVLRLMNYGESSPCKVWFVLDELATLQRLPQLHTAVTENRKSNIPVVLGFQGRSQLEARYGHEAEAMLSQPATKIFLRTSEAKAAEWISRTIGDIETERLTESRSSGEIGQRRKTESHHLERQVEALVMDSEITGLDDLRGYLKKGNLVVRMSFPVVDWPDKHPKFVSRAETKWAQQPPRAAAATVGGETPEQKLMQHEVKQDREHELTRSGPNRDRYFR